MSLVRLPSVRDKYREAVAVDLAAREALRNPKVADEQDKQKVGSKPRRKING